MIFEMTERRMNQALKEEWLVELRRPDAKQTKQVLRSVSDEGRCCLGVFCDLAARYGLGEWIPGATDDRYSFKTPAEYDYTVATVLPDSIARWGKFPDENPMVWDLPGKQYPPTPYSEVSHQSFSLAELNDSGMTFAQIADIIEYFL